MLNSQNLIDKICAKINCGGLTSLETCQTDGALSILSNPVISVTTFNSLPSATEYAGRMIYVQDENRYYHGVDGVWINKFDSNPFNYSDRAFSWGGNLYGQLGNNTTISTRSPVSVVGGISNWSRLSAGRDHSLGLRTDGTIWAWGQNCYGKLGIGTTITTSRSSPVSVICGYTDWCGISAGRCHSLGLRSNGTAWAWGGNGDGRLGDGTTLNRYGPVAIVGGFTDWCQVCASSRHSLGIRANGTAWAWGYNGQGRLGDNTIINKSSPVSVVGGFTDWCQLSSSYNHSLGVRTNGTIYAWGCNQFGQLGIGSTISRSSPTIVVGGFTDWCQVGASANHSVGLRSNGTLWAWGIGNIGQLGDGTNIGKSSPVSVVGGFTDWCQVNAGWCHTVAVRTNGTAWAWGCNANGRLGDNTTINRNSPVSVVGGYTDWCQVSAGDHNIGIRQLCKGI